MSKFFASLFRTNNTILEDPKNMQKFLLVGLGNIGAEYAETRHNIGFKILDALAQDANFKFETLRLGDVGYCKIKGKSIVALKPSTYMNLSGKALRYWMEKEKIAQENVLILTDDINLAFGTLRLKTKGSDGGHNGLKDIQNVLQSTVYNRLRFGVGSDFPIGKQVDYVLSTWSGEEQKLLPERLEKCVALIHSFVFTGIQNTMNQFNGT